MAIDWWMISATIIGPILAVQAQKWVERSRADVQRKQSLFITLMATRAARMSPDHVRALNMIDLTFYGLKSFGGRFRSYKNDEVLKAWKEYIDHLNYSVEGLSEAAMFRMFEERDKLFYAMLERMADALGYSFDRVLLKKHGYNPSGYGVAEGEQEMVRQKLIALLSGETNLKMEITNIPVAYPPNQ